jgi:hypothetical protein
MRAILPRPLLPIVVLGFAAAGCALPRPIVRLYPAGSDIVWVSGRAVVEHAEGGIRAAAAFDHQNGDTVAFRVEIQNDSAERIEIDPKHMQFVTCFAGSSCSARQSAFDPEQVLMALDQERSQEEAKAVNSQVAGSALIFLSATADVASVARGHTRDAGERTALAGIALDSSVNGSEQTLARIDSERVTWATAALRRTTLLAGHGVAGLVYVPLAAKAEYVWLDVPAGGRDFWFRFKQTVTVPPRHGDFTSEG